MLALALLIQATPAPTPTNDSTPRLPARRPVLRVWEAAALGTVTIGAFLLDQSVRNEFQDDRSGASDGLADVANILGEKLVVIPALAVSTAAAKAFHSKGLEGISLRALESTALAGNSVMIVKVIVGRRRPLVSPDDAFDFKPFTFHDNSFPSGHTAVAFALATSLAHETRNPLARGLLYGAASFTALARINDDKHWLSDTVLGATIGALATRLMIRWQRRVVLTPNVVAVRIPL